MRAQIARLQSLYTWHTVEHQTALAAVSQGRCYKTKLESFKLGAVCWNKHQRSRCRQRPNLVSLEQRVLLRFSATTRSPCFRSGSGNFVRTCENGQLPLGFLQLEPSRLLITAS